MAIMTIEHATPTVTWVIPFLRFSQRHVTFKPVSESLAVELSQPGLSMGCMRSIFASVQTLHSINCATMKAEWAGGSCAVHNIMSCHYNAY